MITISKAEYEALGKENVMLKQDLEYVKFQLAKLKKMIFGSKSERTLITDKAQLALGFNLDSNLSSEDAAETDTQEITYTRVKKKKVTLRCSAS